MYISHVKKTVKYENVQFVDEITLQYLLQTELKRTSREPANKCSICFLQNHLILKNENRLLLVIKINL